MLPDRIAVCAGVVALGLLILVPVVVVIAGVVAEHRRLRGEDAE